MKRKKDQIKIGALISYLSIILNIVITLLYTPWMIQKIGQSSYGIYTLAMSLINIFLFDFGMSSSVSRFISKFRAEKREEEIGGFLNLTFKLFSFFSLMLVAVFLIAYFFINQLYRGLNAEELKMFKNLYVVLISYSVVSFLFTPLDGILNAYEEFIAIKAVGLFQKFISILLVIIALALNMGVYSLVLSNAISGFASIATKLVIIFIKKIPLPFGKKYNFALIKETFAFSIWAVVIGVAQRLTFGLAPSILGAVSNSYEIAAFSPANILESYYYGFAAAINGLFLPKVSRYLFNNEIDKIEKLMIKIGKIQIFILGLILVGFVSIGKKFVILWLGDEYIVSYYAAVILFIPDLLLFSQQIANTLLIADNKIKYTAIGYIIAGVTCLCSSPLLSSRFGCFGAALAISIGFFLNFIYMNFCYIKRTKLNMKRFYSECYIKPIISIIISIIISVSLLNITKSEISWNILVFEGLLVLVIFITTYYAIACNRFEKKLIYSTIYNIIKKYCSR